MAEKRRDDGKEEGTEEDKKKIFFKREKGKRGGRINSKVGEGAFSDEIRSRGRSEFGYLIHERGKNGVVESEGRGNGGGGEDAQVRTSVSIFPSLSLFPSLLSLSSSVLISFSPSSRRRRRRRKWDYADPALQTALYSPHLLGPGRIDN